MSLGDELGWKQGNPRAEHEPRGEDTSDQRGIPPGSERADPHCYRRRTRSVAATSGLIVRTTDRAKQKSWATQATFVHLDFTRKTAELFLGLAAAHAGRALSRLRCLARFRRRRRTTRSRSMRACRSSKHGIAPTISSCTERVESSRVINWRTRRF